ncbi:MAG: glycosyltransferase [Candidatus Omnitrophota bacterium]|jgi:glycosyltransferase involved in cell wall biosynthesis
MAPKISILTASLNQGRFLEEMIGSIQAQGFKNYEHIIVDGCSTDNTSAILSKFPHIKLISEKDKSSSEAFIKALSMARGEYIILCCVSDGFLNKDWFRSCVELLDADNDISLVWGLPQYMTEEGRLGRVSTPEFLSEPPPQKKDFLGFWLATGHVMFEGNHCIRKDVFMKCMPASLDDCRFKHNVLYDFVYSFVTSGYLPYFLPVIANYGRIHADALGQLEEVKARVSVSHKQYMAAINRYKNKLFKKEIEHYFRNGTSQVISKLSTPELRSCKMRFHKAKLKLFIYHSIYDLVRFILRKFHLYKIRKWLECW